MTRRISSADGRISAASERQMTTKNSGVCYGSPAKIAVGCVIAAVAALLTASAQSGFFSQLRPFGTVPDMCLAFTVALGMMLGSRFGAVFGVASGFFIDALSADGLSAKILLYLICGALSGLFTVTEFRPIKDIWRYVAFILSACAAKQLLLVMWVVLTAPFIDMAQIIVELILRELICTAFFSIPVYFISAGVFALYARRTSSKNRLSGR